MSQLQRRRASRMIGEWETGSRERMPRGRWSVGRGKEHSEVGDVRGKIMAGCRECLWSVSYTARVNYITV